ncbi:MAG: DUF421 domain-containing protein [Ardenticatenaceae bacterium]|nr:DUF421 domain-containing protein [Anaerolineales bacterium]MCB8921506.1 DUF421 domain-containing protein [Ardenticatenaceae bacterium]MCB8990913.1 DUF421 domain-containing protein [Ardenticatenaceae bacterium]MCB9004980.1 DUF421 domain-containing protein [Ardenticatenaceae bacterium]
MDTLDWHGMFSPSVPILEIVIRGTVVYLVLFVILRLTLKRIGGSSIGLADVLMIALVAAAAQNAIAREHHSITDGVVLVATLAFWSYALDWLGHRYPLFQRFYSPPPLLLVKDGRLLHRNLRTELITEDELLAQIRRAGAKGVTEVAEAHMEGDGTITVILIDD